MARDVKLNIALLQNSFLRFRRKIEKMYAEKKHGVEEDRKTKNDMNINLWRHIQDVTRQTIAILPLIVAETHV